MPLPIEVFRDLCGFLGALHGIPKNHQFSLLLHFADPIKIVYLIVTPSPPQTKQNSVTGIKNQLDQLCTISHCLPV